jgi:type IX secretion system PorP/SprF family membrane protein
MHNKLHLLITFLLCAVSLTAQDIHFTQYNMSPMTLNPALIGKYEGTLRVGGIFRGQWASVIGSKNQYQTPSAYVDAPVIRGFRSRDWVGVGLMVLSDKAGTLGLTHTIGKLGASYHFALDKKGRTYLSAGLHYGSESRKINGENAQFTDGLEKNDPKMSVDFSRLALDGQNYTDMDAGVILSSQLNKMMDFQIGFTMFNLTQPRYTLLGSTSSNPNPNPNPTPSTSNNEDPRRALLHGTFNAKLNDKFTLSPSFLFQTMSGADEIVLQAMAGYLLQPERDLTLRFGTGYRLRDAVQVLVGAQIKNLQIGAAYDINTSGLAVASNNRGGFELAAAYIIKIYKPAKIKPKVLCPRF